MAEDAISARDIVPNLYGDDSDGEYEEEAIDDLSYDVYNLAAFNHHAIRFSDMDAKEEVLHDAALSATQLLIKK